MVNIFAFLPIVLEQSLSVIAGLLLAAASIAYILAITHKDPLKRITPRPLSWIGWTLLMGISVVSQIIKNGFEWNQVTILSSVFFCIVITYISFKTKRYTIKNMDWGCLLLGVICVVTYISTQNALLTTVFGIIADFIVAIPTIHNAYTKPDSEKSSAWWIGLVSWSLTLITCIGHDVLYFIFPMYLFVMHIFFIYLTNRRTSLV